MRRGCGSVCINVNILSPTNIPHTSFIFPSPTESADMATTIAIDIDNMGRVIGKNGVIINMIRKHTNSKIVSNAANSFKITPLDPSNNGTEVAMSMIQYFTSFRTEIEIARAVELFPISQTPPVKKEIKIEKELINPKEPPVPRTYTALRTRRAKKDASLHGERLGTGPRDSMSKAITLANTSSGR